LSIGNLDALAKELGIRSFRKPSSKRASFRDHPLVARNPDGSIPIAPEASRLRLWKNGHVKEVDALDPEAANYEEEVYGKIVKKNFALIVDSVLESAVENKDPQLLGKIMDHSLGRAVEKRDLGGFTEIECHIRMRSGIEPFPDSKALKEIPFEAIPDTEDVAPIQDLNPKTTYQSPEGHLMVRGKDNG
jgi:hypothetical protein